VLENADEPLPFFAWCANISFIQLLADYDMEILFLCFVHAIRVEDFDLYVRTLDEVADWAFILGHYNYAHWLPVHVHNTLNLEYKHSDLYEQFDYGYFTVAKTSP